MTDQFSWMVFLVCKSSCQLQAEFWPQIALYLAPCALCLAFYLAWPDHGSMDGSFKMKVDDSYRVIGKTVELDLVPFEAEKASSS